MSASVHDEDVLTRIIFSVNSAGIRKTSLFFNGESIKFGAEHGNWTLTVFEDCDYPGAAYVFRNVIAEAAEMISQFRGCLRFMGRELRILVQFQV